MEKTQKARRLWRMAGLLAAALALPPAGLAQAGRVIVNFHRVDDHILRGGQPGTEGLRALAGEGVKTILDLRDGETAKEREAAEALGIRYVRVPLSGLHAPADSAISRAIETLEDRTAWPVFVHCVHGRDRTGTVIACYRIQHDGWEKQHALAEAYQYGLSFLERGMKNYILRFTGGADSPAGAAKAEGTRDGSR